MKTYSLRKPIAFMYFWLNYCDENHHIERIPVTVKNVYHLFNLASDSTRIDSTRIDDNEYLTSLENGTELISCTGEQIQKLGIYFEMKRYLSLKNISYPLDIEYLI